MLFARILAIGGQVGLRARAVVKTDISHAPEPTLTPDVQLDRYGIAVRGNQRNAFLYGDMQGHGALSQASQSLQGVGADGQYPKPADACTGGLQPPPPNLTRLTPRATNP